MLASDGVRIITMNPRSRVFDLIATYTSTLAVLAAIAAGYMLRGIPDSNLVTLPSVTIFWYGIVIIATTLVVILVCQYDREMVKGLHNVSNIRAALIAVSATLVFIRLFVPLGKCFE